MERKRNKKIFWTFKTCKEEALKYKTTTDFQAKNNSAYSYACTNKILQEICSHMTNIRKSRNFWNKEECKKVALEYTNRTDFFNNESGAHHYACKNNFIDEICSHMKYVGNLMIRLVYVYEFSDNSVYVGLTHDIDRSEEHTS